MENVERLMGMEDGGTLWKATRTRWGAEAIVRCTLTNGNPGVIVERRTRSGLTARDPYDLTGPHASCLNTWGTLYHTREMADKAGSERRAAMGSQERYTLDYGAH